MNLCIGCFGKLFWSVFLAKQEPGLEEADCSPKYEEACYEYSNFKINSFVNYWNQPLDGRDYSSTEILYCYHMDIIDLCYPFLACICFCLGPIEPYIALEGSKDRHNFLLVWVVGYYFGTKSIAQYYQSAILLWRCHWQQLFYAVYHDIWICWSERSYIYDNPDTQIPVDFWYITFHWLHLFSVSFWLVKMM